MIFKEFSSISNCEGFFFFFGEGGQLGISTQISPTLKWYLWPQRYQIRITQHVLKLTVNIAKNIHLFFQWSVLGSLLLDAVTTNVSSVDFHMSHDKMLLFSNFGGCLKFCHIRTISVCYNLSLPKISRPLFSFQCISFYWNCFIHSNVVSLSIFLCFNNFYLFVFMFHHLIVNGILYD